MTNQKNVLYLTKAQAQTRRLYLTDGQVAWIARMSKLEPFPLSRPSTPKIEPNEPMVTCYDAHEEQQSRSMQKIMGALDMCTLKVPKIKKAKKKTRGTYRSCIRTLYDTGLLNPYMTIDQLSKCNLENIVDDTKKLNGYTEGTLQNKASAFISLTTYLARRFNGLKKALPKNSGVNKTFYSVSKKCKTSTMTHKQWCDWLYELEQINYRDYLIALVMIQGAKRISEVLSLQVNQVDFEAMRIRFVQSKTGGEFQYTSIAYPKSVMDKLKAYIGDRVGLAFVTSSGKQVGQLQLQITFEKAGLKSGIKYKIHPHVLRASAITYLVEQGYSSEQIMKISGHSSPKSVIYYDRSSIENNISSEVCLV